MGWSIWKIKSKSSQLQHDQLNMAFLLLTIWGRETLLDKGR